MDESEFEEEYNSLLNEAADVYQRRKHKCIWFEEATRSCWLTHRRTWDRGAREEDWSQ